MTSKISGGCLCGGVQYESTGMPKQMINCHCSMCRKVVGASYGTYIRVPLANLKFLKSGTKKTYASSGSVTRHFCGKCGGSIMDIGTNDKEHAWLTAGSVTGDPGVRLYAHIFTNSKAPWISIEDGMPSSGEAELLTELLETERK